MIQYCPSCGEKLEAGSAFCNECGTKIPDDPMLICPACGEANKPKARFCKKCGDKIVHPSDMVICPECDEVCYSSAQFCMYCGEKFYWDEEEGDASEDTPTDTCDPHEKIAGMDLSLKDVVRNSVAKDSEKPSVPVKKKIPTWGWICIGVALLLFIVWSQGSQSTYYEPGEHDAIAVSTMSEEDYKSACTVIAYRNVARNPTNYVGAKAVYTGKVIQVMENGKNVVLRVNVTRGSYSWDDTMYVEYRRKSETESRILEDDIITMYGEILGIKEYTSILGSEISIPHLKAEYIEIN